MVLGVSPLPLDRGSMRLVSTEIPISLSAFIGVKLWIKVTNLKWGSPPASTILSVSLQFHSFHLILVVFQKLELQESPLSSPKLPSGQIPEVRSCSSTVGIEPQISLMKNQHFTAEPSWQLYNQLKWEWIQAQTLSQKKEEVLSAVPFNIKWSKKKSKQNCSCRQLFL